MRIMLRRFDRASIVRGFYTGYGGCTLNRRFLFWYSYVVGGKEVFVPRWNLKYLGYKRPDFHTKVRERMIRDDRNKK